MKAIKAENFRMITRLAEELESAVNEIENRVEEEKEAMADVLPDKTHEATVNNEDINCASVDNEDINCATDEKEEDAKVATAEKLVSIASVLMKKQKPLTASQKVSLQKFLVKVAKDIEVIEDKKEKKDEKIETAKVATAEKLVSIATVLMKKQKPLTASQKVLLQNFLVKVAKDMETVG